MCVAFGSCVFIGNWLVGRRAFKIIRWRRYLQTWTMGGRERERGRVGEERETLIMYFSRNKVLDMFFHAYHSYMVSL